ncbi:MAG: hypothetical protein WBH31_11705 [Promethearchaeia archaeon]
MMFQKKRKYYAVFMVNQEGSYSYIGKKRFRPSQKNLRFKKGTYEIKKMIPSYIKGMKLYYFYDLEKGQIYFGKSNSNADPEIDDLIIYKKIVAQITSRLSGSPFKINIMWLLMGAIMGIFGTISVFYFM